jgi:outer membrane protein OmpA-like peptidoglycan-associated protein
MRLQFLLFISSILLALGNVFGQNIKTANYLFDNFEFQGAIEEYEKFEDLSKLSKEDQQKLGYCYYITGDVEGGLPYLKSIAGQQAEEAHFWLWKGTLEKENNEFENAIQSFKTFKTKTDELSAEIDLLINSCEVIPTWDSIPRTTISNVSLNTPFAESCSTFDKQLIFFKEIGLDSTGSVINFQVDSTVIPEVLLMTPYLSNNDSLSQSILFSKVKSLSINRVQLYSDNSKVIFSASDPLNKNKILNNQQIYIADFLSLDKPLENVKLWEYSGINDTSSCSHVCLSPNGQMIVFTKTSKNTAGSDLYFSDLSNGKWSEPAALNAANTRGNEMFPLFQNDSILQFSTDGRIGYGGLDIFTLNLKSTDAESGLKHFHFPVNSPMDDYNLIWTDSLNAYFVSNRKNGKGDDDIWKLTTEPEKKPEIVDDGFKKWYDQWNLKLIYFDFDSFESDVNQEFIQGCKKYFEKYKVEVKLVGHTDARGVPEYNMYLGMNRCKWLEKQLKDANVQNKIILESVGETQLVNKCDSKTKCSEEEHMKNRFVQIFIQFDQNIIE